MIVSLAHRDDPFAGVLVSAITDEIVDLSNDVTQRPVERGSDITDHVREKPKRLEIRGIINDRLVDGNTVYDQWAKINRMFTDREKIQVYMSLDVFPDMVITDLTVIRMEASAVEFRAWFVQVREVDSQQVVVPAATSKQPAKRPKSVSILKQSGDKQTTRAAKADAPKSLLKTATLMFGS